MSSIEFKGLQIEHICNIRLKNSYISINPHAGITLKTPKVSQSYIFDLLEKKESWIRKKIAQLKAKKLLRVSIEDEVVLFGEVMSIDSHQAISLREELSKINTNNTKAILKAYDNFYKYIAIAYITPKVEYFAQRMKLDYHKITFKKYKSRWGSCNSNKELSFNINLIKLETSFIDYVIVHELSHLVHMNHSKSFHALTQRYIPHAKELKAKMKMLRIIEL